MFYADDPAPFTKFVTLFSLILTFFYIQV